MALLSLILPYRDAASTLNEAIQSILDQTFRDYEVIAVNDHSRDESPEILSSICDSRFQLYDNPGEGLVDALNFALSRASAPWIARMDADDIMHPDKLEIQWQYLLVHSEVDVLSCQAQLFPEQIITDGFLEYINWQNRVLTQQDFQDQCYVEMPLTNPTAIFRKAMFEALGEYRKGEVPEDYEFWLRALHAGYRFEKIPQVLFYWRDSLQRYTRTSPACSRAAFDRVRADYLARDPRLHEGRPLVYCGAGRKTRKRANLMIERGFSPHVWIDIDPAKIGNKLQGVPVAAPTWVIENRDLNPFVLIYIASHGARDQLSGWLQDNGFYPGHDYLAIG